MRSERRLKDFAIVLPIVGILLFLPPYIRIFDTDVSLAGIPLLNIWIFTIWFIGILLTAVFARRLANDSECRGSDGQIEAKEDNSSYLRIQGGRPSSDSNVANGRED